MIKASAFLAAGTLEDFSQELSNARSLGASACEVYEIVLQCYLFLGYPKAIEGLKRFRVCFTDYRSSSSDTGGGVECSSWSDKGEELCKIVYGKNYEALRRFMRAISPELDSWMIWEGYGKVLSRPGPPPVLRELCTCSALTVTGDFVQLHSHLRGASYTGASRGDLLAVVEIVDGIASSDNRARAGAIIQEIAGKGN
jgi:4-carboxymuconolactone decarboxylase